MKVLLNELHFNFIYFISRNYRSRQSTKNSTLNNQNNQVRKKVRKREAQINESSRHFQEKFPPLLGNIPAQSVPLYWMTTVSISPRFLASLLAVQLIPSKEAALTFCIFFLFPRLEVVCGGADCCVPPAPPFLLLPVWGN